MVNTCTVYLSSSFKFKTRDVTYETISFFVLVNVVLGIYAHRIKELFISSYPLISQLRECIHNDTKHNVQADGGHNDEK